MLFLNMINCFRYCPRACIPLMSGPTVFTERSLRTMLSLRSIIRFLPVPALGIRRSEDRQAGQIRSAMLAMLQLPNGRMVQRVAQRVQFADDLEALWYLRQDVMTALSDFDGEGAARRQMKQINSMF